MNFFPFINNSNQRFKFIGLTSGVTYDNQTFTKSSIFTEQENQPQPDIKSIRNRVFKNKSTYKPKFTSPRNIDERSSVHRARSNQSESKKKNINSLLTIQTSHSNNHSNNQKIKFEHLFTDISVRIINQIDKYSDIDARTIHINLSFYYQNFFSKKIKNSLTKQFLHTTEAYIKKFRESIDQQIVWDRVPQELFCFDSCEDILRKIEKLEGKGKEEFIQVLIKYYCVPSKQYRNSILRDIVLLLTQQAKKNLSNVITTQQIKQFVLLDSNGKLITDIIDIPFSTQILHIVNKNCNYKHIFARFTSIFNNYNEMEGKNKFVSGLKKDFRQKITKGMFHNLQSYELNLQNQSKISKKRSQHAETIIKNHRNTSLSSQSKIKYSTIESNNLKLRLSMMKSRKKKSINLTLSPKKSLASHRTSKYSEQFQKLRQKNNIQSQFLTIQTLQQNINFLTNKTNQQILKIFKSLKILSSSSPPQKTKVNQQQFIKLLSIANNSSNHYQQSQDIIDFVNNFIKFDEFDELDRINLSQSLQEILDENENENKELYEEILWTWFEKNNLIENNVVFKEKLQGAYERNKLFYSFVVSLILNYKHISAMDMAYEILM